MALKFIINDPVEVPGPQRDLYTKAEDGKYHLALDGHPDTAKVSEMRAKNIAVMQERDALKTTLAQFGDLDPVAAKEAIAKLAANSDEAAALKSELATVKGQHAAAQAKADRGVLRDALRGKLLAAGALPAAVDIALDKAEPKFTIAGDTVTAKAGGPADVDEWILSAISEFPFLFAPSRGGGADPKPPRLGASNVKELVNPTAQELGAHSKEIASGKLKVVHTT